MTLQRNVKRRTLAPGGLSGIPLGQTQPLKEYQVMINPYAQPKKALSRQ
jgi:hypothetical protein